MPGTNRGRADDALARQVIGERLAARALALEGGDGQGLCGGGLGDQLILAGIGLEVFELQLHLRHEALAAFCAGSVRLALQLGDLQLEVGDHRLGGALAGHGRYPALCGRQLYCGLRQSIPSSRQASWALVSDTIPSFADVQKAPVLEALGVKRHADTIMPDDLGQRSGTPSKDEEIAAERIAP